MSQSLSRIYLHLVFSTKDRYPYFAAKDLRAELHSYLGGVIKKLGSQPIEIGGVSDHIHALILFPRTATVADIVKETKRASTIWVREQKDIWKNFHWQGGYGAFSVSQSSVERVVHYIQGQEEHHKRVSFQDEYRSFLKKHGVEFDEKYVWD